MSNINGTCNGKTLIENVDYKVNGNTVKNLSSFYGNVTISYTNERKPNRAERRRK